MSRAFGWLFGVTIVLVALACLGFALPVDFGFALLAGWAFYLARTLPEVRVAPSGALTAMVCLVFLVVGLQYFLAWLHREIRPPSGDLPARHSRWKWRWTLYLVAGVIVLFTAGTATVGVTHQLGWLITSREPLVVSDSRAAQRAQSTNNLKQIGLALHEYEVRNLSFPPGGSFDQIGRPFQSWQTAVLPYMEEQALFQQINMSAAWNDHENVPVFQTVIQTYLGPGINAQKNEAGYALSHYAGSVDMLGGDRPRTLSDVSDGTANTMMVGEVVTDFKAWGDPTNWRDSRLGLNRSPQGFGSAYPGGANFLFVDGSVKFLKNSIDPQVLKALSTPAGYEKVNSDQY
jgi:prepilin-type processing-associated H-X9-DG protein